MVMDVWLELMRVLPRSNVLPYTRGSRRRKAYKMGVKLIPRT